MTKATAKLLLKALLTTILIGVVVHVVDFRKAVAGIRDAELLWLLGSFLGLILSVVLQSLRWRMMLRRPDIPLHKFAYFLFMGFFLNMVIPTQVGSDIVRSAAFGRKYGDVGLNIGLGLAQRVLGLLVLGVFALVGAWFYRDALLAYAADLSLSTTPILVAGAGLAIVGILLWLFRHRLARSVALRALFASLTDPDLLFKALGYSLLIQIVTSISTWLLFRAVFPHPDFWQITLFTSIAQVALLLPLSLGGMGIRDVLTLALYSGIGKLPADQIVTVNLLGYSSLLLLAATGGAWMGFRWLISGTNPLRAEPPAPEDDVQPDSTPR